MTRPVPLVEELQRLIRVDRAARELTQMAARHFNVQKMRADGDHERVYISVTGTAFLALWDAVHAVNERCPGLIYPDVEHEALRTRLRRLPHWERDELLSEFRGRR